jgi:ribosome maturation factor RimP
MNEKLIENINNIVSDLDLIIYDIRFTKFDNNDIFEVVVDNESNNIGMELIEKVTRPISKMLDDFEKDMPKNYYLQVISPGIRRKIKNIKHYELSIGKTLIIKYHNGEKTVKVQGKLLKTNPILLEVDGESIKIEFDTIKEGK